MKNMKKYLAIAFLILLLSPVHKILAQDLSGLWKGTLYNDTTKKYYPYQIIISEENGKLSGYSYIVYDINGKPETAVRTLKIKKKDAKLIIEDDELIYNDYTEPPPKGIHKMTIGTVTIVDTLMTLQGEWHTNRTKKYLPLAGTFSVQKKYDYKPAELFKKLEDLNLTAKLSFTPKEKPVEQPVVAVVPKPIKKEKPAVVVKETKKPEPVVVKKPAVIKPLPVAPIAAAADVAKRKIVNTQEVFFTADSLTLTLYDNGEVDGDVVSVLLNGKVIFEKAALTTKPNRKTIYIDKAASSDSLQLVMYAENLGSIPPNTGLLVVNDGEATYEVRFSADLQTNSAILLRRKK